MTPWLIGGLTLLGTIGGAVAAWLAHCPHRRWRVTTSDWVGTHRRGDLTPEQIHEALDEPDTTQPGRSDS